MFSGQSAGVHDVSKQAWMTASRRDRQVQGTSPAAGQSLIHGHTHSSLALSPTLVVEVVAEPTVIVGLR